MNRTILWIMNVFCFLITIDVLPVDFQWENRYTDKAESKWYYFYDNNVLVEGYLGPVRSNVNINEKSAVTAVRSKTVPSDRFLNRRCPLDYTSYTYANSQTPEFLWEDQDNLVIATRYSVVKNLIAVENTITWKTNLSYDISETIL